MRQVLIRTATLTLGFEIPHLREIADAARALEESYRFNLHSDGTAVLVNIER